MPIFEYLCKDCNQRFEALVMGSNHAECPKCHGRKLEQQLSVFSTPATHRGASFGSLETPGPSACGSCGHPGGPGSCSLDD